MQRHFSCSLFLSFSLRMDSSTPNPTWTGFLIGLFGGVAVSSLLIGLVLGYSVSGSLGMPLRAPGDVAAVPSAPTLPAEPAAPAGKGPAEVTKRDHVRGKADAKVTVVVYSDFECPFCKRFAPTTNEILTQYKDDVNVVFRHFPLSFHANAQKEAEGSECAAELGGNDAFWKFHDYIFEKTTANGTGFALDQLAVAATASGVDKTKFQKCLDSGKYAQYVKDQEQEGITAGVQGTPGSFVVNNETKDFKDISGAVPLSTFQATIDPMLGKK